MPGSSWKVAWVESQRMADRARIVAPVVFLLTVGQLAVATFVPGLPQFEGKAFGARLIFYPCLMAVVPVACWLVRRRTPVGTPFPWLATPS